MTNVRITLKSRMESRNFLQVKKQKDEVPIKRFNDRS